MKVDTVVVILLVLILVWLWLNRPERFSGLDDALLDQEKRLPQWDDQELAELEQKVRDALNKSNSEVRADQEDALKYDSEKNGAPAATSPGQVENNMTEMFAVGHISSAFSPIDHFSTIHVLDAQSQLSQLEHAMDPEDRVRAALFDRRNQ